MQSTHDPCKANKQKKPGLRNHKANPNIWLQTSLKQYLNGTCGYEPTISSRKIINWQLEAPSFDTNIFLWKYGQMWDVRNVEINNQTPKNKRGKPTPGHLNHLHLAPCGVYRNTSPKTINTSSSELLNGPFQFHLLQCHNKRCSNKAHPIFLRNPQYWSSVLI